MKKDFSPVMSLLSAPELECGLSVLLDAIHRYFDTTVNEAFLERWKTIRDNYDLLLEYVNRGIDDPQREEVYMRQLRAAYTLMLDMEHFEQVNSNRSYALAHSRSFAFDDPLFKVKNTLEDYVSSRPMVDLEKNTKGGEDKQGLDERNQRYVEQLFDHILVSSSWAAPDADFYVKMLLSPTIERRNALQIVSAITLSASDVFDLQKLRVLYRLAVESTDVYVRQRALVGFVLAADERYAVVFPELRDMARQLTAKTSSVTPDDLFDLQVQLFYCLTVREDTEKLNNDIIPDLVGESNLHVGRNGIITEKDDDPMDDILFGNKDDEERMARLEESVNKMYEMQKAGSDIYFGGFSQMKRAPFFSKVSNWFCPFYTEHYELHSIVANSFGSYGVPAMLKGDGPFCDSDRYSFLIALSTLFLRLPDGVREMLANSKNMAMGVAEPGVYSTPAYIRRMYLQDLYRFFELYTDRADFRNMFGSTERPHSYLFMANSLFGTVATEEDVFRLCDFLLKRRRYDDLLYLLDQQADRKDKLTPWRVLYYRGVALLRHGDAPQACGYMEKAWQAYRQTAVDSKIEAKMLRMLARSAVTAGQYDLACDAYGKLLKLNPNDLKAKTNCLLSMIELGRTDEALKLAYELSFADEHSLVVKRAYAWALLNAGKVDAAQREYTQLLASHDADTNDFLNAAYCFWVQGKLAEAVDNMSRFFILWRDTEDYDKYKGTDVERLTNKLQQDAHLLARLSMDRPQQALLVEIVIDKVEEEDD